MPRLYRIEALTVVLTLGFFLIGCGGATQPASGPGSAAGDTQVSPRQYTYKPIKTRPLMKEFMGINGHTVLFRPKLYSAVSALVRDYHSMAWDVGEDTSYKVEFPFARNRVNWESVYGSWRAEGFDIDVSIMLGEIKPQTWKDKARDAYAYGRAFASFFGPSSRNLVQSAEIGNEPGEYSDPDYRVVFENMARGLREGDPKLKVVTANMTLGKSGEYDKSITTVDQLQELYDVLNIHVYAQVEGWPTWRRSYPEDPGVDYLHRVKELIDWRDQHAPGKQIWITEFGWDASTKPPPAEGTFKDWIGVTEQQQAQYLVRSHLVFSVMEVDRAYIFFFNDEDAPQVHGSSGLTRNFEPKPAFHAVAHLYRTLGNYRLTGVLQSKPDHPYVYEFTNATLPTDKIVVIWLATAGNKQARVSIDLDGASVVKAERSPLTADAPSPVSVSVQGGQLAVDADETPLFVWTRE